MPDVFTWSHLGTLVAFAGLIVTIWKIRRDDWKEIDKKIESVALSLVAFKLQVSEQHPTVGDLIRLEDRFIDAIKELTLRIDRVLEQRK